MKNSIKKVLVKLRVLESRSSMSHEEVNFPGGIVPINQTQPEDVFIVGFPKSGNTLMQHIISHLVYGINEVGSRSMVNLIVPDVYANSHYFRFNDSCYFKSHERPQPSYKKVIYLIRDGRDVLLSYYRMMKNMGKELSLEDLYEGKIKIYGGLWHEHIEEWESNPFQANILWIKYEDLKHDKKHQLNRICEFLQIERSSESLEKVLELTSIEHMKMLEKRSDWKKMKMKNNFTKGDFVRNGLSKSHTEQVDIRLVNKFVENSKNNFYNFKDCPNT